jgi:hypothetical protein
MAAFHQVDDLSDTYEAQMESAMRAGWDDPLMDDYNRASSMSQLSSASASSPSSDDSLGGS